MATIVNIRYLPLHKIFSKYFLQSLLLSKALVVGFRRDKMEEEDGTPRLVEEGSLIRLEGDPEIEYLGAEDLMLASTSSILTQPPATSRNVPQHQDNGLAKHVKLTCHRFCPIRQISLNNTLSTGVNTRLSTETLWTGTFKQYMIK